MSQFQAFDVFGILLICYYICICAQQLREQFLFLQLVLLAQQRCWGFPNRLYFAMLPPSLACAAFFPANSTSSTHTDKKMQPAMQISAHSGDVFPFFFKAFFSICLSQKSSSKWMAVKDCARAVYSVVPRIVLHNITSQNHSSFVLLETVSPIGVL